jgi:DNA-binding NtrC family response regulator
MNILIADDEKGIRLGLSRLLKREGFTTFEAESGSIAMEIADREEIHGALIDIRLGEEDGIVILRELLKRYPGIVCIMITGYGSIANAVEAVRSGAADYLLKPVDNNQIIAALKTRLELKQLKAENRFLKSRELEKSLECDLNTGNPRMKNVMTLADRVKNTDSTILISGESGTGKEVLCRYIHFTSDRKDFPFIGVNCAALSESLLLSELFGHEKGAFTGAHERKEGKFELAHGGTLFLDEIGDMAPEAQAKLLRVLEESSFERVGGNKSIHVDIRVAAATNQDLELLIKDGRFRQDLYYRLNVINLVLPPLRERREDIVRLAEYFGKLYSRKFRKEYTGFKEGTQNAMINNPWPGNIRELRNAVHQAVLMSDEEMLELPSITVQPPPDGKESDTACDRPVSSLADQLLAISEAAEKQLIMKALEECKYNRTAAAEALEISRKTLFNKMEKYRL